MLVVYGCNSWVDFFAAMSRDDETQRCETDALYRMLSERPASCDAAADSAAAAAGRDAEFDRTQRDVASLQLQVLHPTPNI
jgi:hypothetical protein